MADGGGPCKKPFISGTQIGPPSKGGSGEPIGCHTRGLAVIRRLGRRWLRPSAPQDWLGHGGLGPARGVGLEVPRAAQRPGGAGDEAGGAERPGGGGLALACQGSLCHGRQVGRAPAVCLAYGASGLRARQRGPGWTPDLQGDQSRRPYPRGSGAPRSISAQAQGPYQDSRVRVLCSSSRSLELVWNLGSSQSAAGPSQLPGWPAAGCRYSQPPDSHQLGSKSAPGPPEKAEGVGSWACVTCI